MNKSSWLQYESSNVESNMTIYCIHPAGATASIFQPWLKSLKDGYSLVAVQLPGREHRFKEQPYTDVKALVEDLGHSISERLSGDFVFFGHSFGALVAFEFTCWLRDKQLPLPKHLFLASRGAPHIKKRFKPVYHLTDEKLIDVLRIYGGTSEDILQNKEAMCFFLPAIRADLQANDTHEHRMGANLDVDITAMCGMEDPVCNLNEINAWNELTTGNFSSELLSGGHFFYKRNQEVVLDIIESRLNLASNNTASMALT